MKTVTSVIAALLAAALLACGGTDQPPEVGMCRMTFPLSTCNSTCTLQRQWTNSCQSELLATRMLELGNGTSGAHWEGQESTPNGLVTCAYDLTLTPTPGDGSAGTGTLSVSSAQDVSVCPTLPEHFEYTFDQCNCALSVFDPHGASAALYY